MKNTAMTLLAGLALAATAQAGTGYSSKGGKEIIPPAAAPCLWTWFAGGSVGYVAGDWDEEIYTLHVGAEYKCPGSNCSQAIFLEVGYTEKKESFNDTTTGSPTFGRNTIEAEVIPITLNYKYECSLTNKLNWYVGGGAGIALVDLDVRTPAGNGSADDSTFYAHAFVGLVYNVSPSFEIFTGAKYIWMDDVNFGGGSSNDIDGPLDGDIHYELGARYNF